MWNRCPLRGVDDIRGNRLWKPIAESHIRLFKCRYILNRRLISHRETPFFLSECLAECALCQIYTENNCAGKKKGVKWSSWSSRYNSSVTDTHTLSAVHHSPVGLRRDGWCKLVPPPLFFFLLLPRHCYYSFAWLPANVPCKNQPSSLLMYFAARCTNRSDKSPSRPLPTPKKGRVGIIYRFSCGAASVFLRPRLCALAWDSFDLSEWWMAVWLGNRCGEMWQGQTTRQRLLLKIWIVNVGLHTWRALAIHHVSSGSRWLWKQDYRYRNDDMHDVTDKYRR